MTISWENLIYQNVLFRFYLNLGGGSIEPICGIYCIENLINHKKYVGLSKNCIKRWWDHRSKAFHSTKEDEIKKPLYMAIRKYGLENFSFSILEECKLEELKEREIYWIQKLDSYRTGYNATLGGDLPEGHVLKGEEHGCAKLTEKDVIFCRQQYSLGKSCKEIYEQHNFSDKISMAGFKNMWFGRSWKHVMPEVFENNPRPKRKITDEQILDIRTRYFQGQSIKQITEVYKGICSHTSICDIVNNKRYVDIQPDIPDNHISESQKVTEEDVRLIKKLKAEGKLHKEIKAILGDKVSMTTISDIVNNKRYAEIN